jgi:GNAT superfamily N-acetyltransferase
VVTLADGRSVRIRRIAPSDADALARAYDDLSWEAKVARFGSPPAELRGDPLSYLVSPDGVDHVAFVAETTGDPAAGIVGVGRILRYPDDPDSLDIGLTVADDIRGLGLGRVLAAALAVHRPRPARRLLTAVGRTNDAALRLLTEFGLPQRRTDDLVEVDLSG